MQHALFELALETITQDGLDMVNQVVDVFHRADGATEVEVYDIPA